MHVLGPVYKPSSSQDTIKELFSDLEYRCETLIWPHVHALLQTEHVGQQCLERTFRESETIV